MMLEDIAQRAYQQFKQSGGITVNLQGEEPTTGYAYGGYVELEKVLPEQAVTPDSILQYMQDNERALAMPGHYLGVWHDMQSGNVFLDVSIVSPPGPDALKDAKERNNIAVWDFENGVEIPTGLSRDQKITSAVDHQAVLDTNRGQDLQGLPGPVNVPGHGPLQFGSHADIQRVANEYNQANGLGAHPNDYLKVNPGHAARIAQEFEHMQHNPNDPQVRQAYDALAREVRAQYDHAVRNGYQFEFYPDHDPYPNSPREAVLDLHHNKHMYVYPTQAGYGQEGEDPQDHPLLGDSGVRWNGQPVTHNDLFRAIHDFYGHAKEGVGFRADGEDNAYRQHAAMFTPQARAALASETRGQNSWVNFGPHGAHNQNATSDTVYAQQKAGLMPDWTHEPDLHAQRTAAAFPDKDAWRAQSGTSWNANLAPEQITHHQGETPGIGTTQHRPVLWYGWSRQLATGQPGTSHEQLRGEMQSKGVEQAEHDASAHMQSHFQYSHPTSDPDEYGVITPNNELVWYGTHDDMGEELGSRDEGRAINALLGTQDRGVGRGPVEGACQACDGTGMDPDATYYHESLGGCDACHGTGRMAAGWEGMFSHVASGYEWSPGQRAKGALMPSGEVRMWPASMGSHYDMAPGHAGWFDIDERGYMGGSPQHMQEVRAKLEHLPLAPKQQGWDTFASAEPTKYTINEISPLDVKPPPNDHDKWVAHRRPFIIHNNVIHIGALGTHHGGIYGYLRIPPRSNVYEGMVNTEPEHADGDGFVHWWTSPPPEQAVDAELALSLHYPDVANRWAGPGSWENTFSSFKQSSLQVMQGTTTKENSLYAADADDLFKNWDKSTPVIRKDDTIYVGHPHTHHQDLRVEFDLPFNNQGVSTGHIGPDGKYYEAINTAGHDSAETAQALGLEYASGDNWMQTFAKVASGRKLWVDDERRPDASWDWARNVAQARSMLSQNDYEHVALDHDLGTYLTPHGQAFDPEAEDGSELADWMVENRRVPPSVSIHSHNPHGAAYMHRVLSPHTKVVVQPYGGSEITDPQAVMNDDWDGMWVGKIAGDMNGPGHSWRPGTNGKGYIDSDGDVHTWSTNEHGGADINGVHKPEYDGPHHVEMAEQYGLEDDPEYDGGAGAHWHTPFYISPNGDATLMSYWYDKSGQRANLDRVRAVGLNPIGGDGWQQTFSKVTAVEDFTSFEPGWYHAAPTTERERIRAHGLQPSNPSISGNWDERLNFFGIDPKEWGSKIPTGVYAFPSPELAREYAQEAGWQADIWHIPGQHIRDARPDPDLASYYYKHNRPVAITHHVQPNLFEPYEHVYKPKPEWMDDFRGEDWDDMWDDAYDKLQDATKRGSHSYTREGSKRHNSTFEHAGMWRVAGELRPPSKPMARCHFHPERFAVANGGFADMCEDCTHSYINAGARLNAPRIPTRDMRTVDPKRLAWSLPEGYGITGPQSLEEHAMMNIDHVMPPGVCPQCGVNTRFPLGLCPHCGYNLQHRQAHASHSILPNSLSDSDFDDGEFPWIAVDGQTYWGEGWDGLHADVARRHGLTSDQLMRSTFGRGVKGGDDILVSTPEGREFTNTRERMQLERGLWDSHGPKGWENAFMSRAASNTPPGMHPYKGGKGKGVIVNGQAYTWDTFNDDVAMFDTHHMNAIGKLVAAGLNVGDGRVPMFWMNAQGKVMASDDETQQLASQLTGLPMHEDQINHFGRQRRKDQFTEWEWIREQWENEGGYVPPEPEPQDTLDDWDNGGGEADPTAIDPDEYREPPDVPSPTFLEDDNEEGEQRIAHTHVERVSSTGKITCQLCGEDMGRVAHTLPTAPARPYTQARTYGPEPMQELRQALGLKPLTDNRPSCKEFLAHSGIREPRQIAAEGWESFSNIPAGTPEVSWPEKYTDWWEDLNSHPEWVYHATPIAKLDQVMKEGLIPQVGPGTQKVWPKAQPYIHALHHPEALRDRYEDHLHENYGPMAVVRAPGHYFEHYLGEPDEDWGALDDGSGREMGTFTTNKPIPPHELVDTGLRWHERRPVKEPSWQIGWKGGALERGLPSAGRNPDGTALVVPGFNHDACPRCGGVWDPDGMCTRCGYEIPYDGQEILEGHEGPGWAFENLHEWDTGDLPRNFGSHIDGTDGGDSELSARIAGTLRPLPKVGGFPPKETPRLVEHQTKNWAGDSYMGNDYAGRRPMVYDPAKNELHLGSPGSIHADLVGFADLRYSPASLSYGWLGHNPESGRGDVIEGKGENEYGWQYKHPGPHVDAAIAHLRPQKEPTREDWPTLFSRTANEDIPVPPGKPSHGTAYVPWKPGDPGKGFYNHTTDQLEMWKVFAPSGDWGDSYYSPFHGPSSFDRDNARVTPFWVDPEGVVSSYGQPVGDDLLQAHPHFKDGSWTWSDHFGATLPMQVIDVAGHDTQGDSHPIAYVPSMRTVFKGERGMDHWGLVEGSPELKQLHKPDDAVQTLHPINRRIAPVFHGRMSDTGDVFFFDDYNMPEVGEHAEVAKALGGKPRFPYGWGEAFSKVAVAEEPFTYESWPYGGGRNKPVPVIKTPDGKVHKGKGVYFHADLAKEILGKPYTKEDIRNSDFGEADHLRAPVTWVTQGPQQTQNRMDSEVYWNGVFGNANPKSRIFIETADGQRHWGEPEDEVHAQVAKRHNLSPQQLVNSFFGYSNTMGEDHWITGNPGSTQDRMYNEGDLWEKEGPEGWQTPDSWNGWWDMFNKQGAGRDPWQDGDPIEPWEPGHPGKGMMFDGKPVAWKLTDQWGGPHHNDVAYAMDSSEEKSPQGYFHIDPDGTTQAEGYADVESFVAHDPRLKLPKELTKWDDVFQADNDPEQLLAKVADWNGSKLGLPDIIEGQTPAEKSLFHNMNAPDRTGVRPVVYHKPTRTVYVGQPGTHHADVVNEHSLHEEPFLEGATPSWLGEPEDQPFNWTSDELGGSHMAHLGYALIEPMHHGGYGLTTWGGFPHDGALALHAAGHINEVHHDQRWDQAFGKAGAVWNPQTSEWDLTPEEKANIKINVVRRQGEPTDGAYNETYEEDFRKRTPILYKGDTVWAGHPGDTHQDIATEFGLGDVDDLDTYHHGSWLPQGGFNKEPGSLNWLYNYGSLKKEWNEAILKALNAKEDDSDWSQAFSKTAMYQVQVVKPVPNPYGHRQLRPFIANEDGIVYIGGESATHGSVYEQMPNGWGKHQRGLLDTKNKKYQALDSGYLPEGAHEALRDMGFEPHREGWSQSFMGKTADNGPAFKWYDQGELDPGKGKDYQGDHSFLYEPETDTVHIGTPDMQHMDISVAAGRPRAVAGWVYDNQFGGHLDQTQYDRLYQIFKHMHMNTTGERLDQSTPEAFENYFGKIAFGPQHSLVWEPGWPGKGFMHNGEVTTWGTNSNRQIDGWPHHVHMFGQRYPGVTLDINDPNQFHFLIEPEGQIREAHPYKGDWDATLAQLHAIEPRFKQAQEEAWQDQF